MGHRLLSLLHDHQGTAGADPRHRDAAGRAPEDRASVLSIATLVFRLSFVVAGPPIGALVDRLGMETALGVLAVVLGVPAFLGLRAFSVAR